jgi:hypothetical protein
MRIARATSALAAGLLLAAAGAGRTQQASGPPAETDAAAPRGNPSQGLPGRHPVVPPASPAGDQLLPPPTVVPGPPAAPVLGPPPGAERLPAATGHSAEAGHPPAPPLAEGEAACTAGPGGPALAKPWSWEQGDGLPRQHPLAPVDFGQPALGYYLYGHFRTQVGNAVAARMTLYEYDFVCGTDKLNPRGTDRLGRIAGLLGHINNPVTIERTPHAPGLAEARRQAVLHAFEGAGVPLPPELVVIGPPVTRPLEGVEAMLIYDNLLLQTQIGGTPGTAARGGTGTQTAPFTGPGPAAGAPTAR